LFSALGGGYGAQGLLKIISMQNLYQLLNLLVAFKKARMQVLAEFEEFGKKGLLRTYGDCPSWTSFQEAENELYWKIEEMEITDFDVDGSDKLSLQMALVQSERQLKDVIDFLEEKELGEDFNDWLHEHDPDKAS
jgi:hypothetical protein